MRPRTLSASPSQEEKALIGPGDFVKLGFLLSRKGHVTVERMWIQVVAVVGDVVTGTLANFPEWLSGARFGDVIRAEKRHVLQIHQARQRTVQ